MLKEYTSILRRLLIFSDYALMVAAFVLAHVFYVHIGPTGQDPNFPRAYLGLFAAIMLAWGWSLKILGMYESFRLKKIQEVLSALARSAAVSFIVFANIAYIFKIQNTSRLFVGLFFALTFTLLALEKLAIVFFFRRLRASGFNFRNVLIIGTGRRAQNYMLFLDHQKELGLKIIGVVDEDPAQVGTTIQGHEIIGHLGQLPQILREYIIDYAIFIVPRGSLNKIEPALMHCEMTGVTASVAVDLFDLKFSHVKEIDMLGIPMITFEATEHSLPALALKRLVDIAISGAALILISPLYAAIAILIKKTSPGPVYFAQERCGLNGRKFKLYKFRTMVVDAEEQLKNLLAYNEMSGPVFKMENDPRITKIGKFLRKYSLDELPQLWNVFRGDMSLVGPRPPLPSEVCRYDPWHRRRLSVRPGITCIWQAGGRNRISNFDQWVKMDLDYIDHWSLMLDFKIMFKTIPAVLMASGAK